MAWTQRKDWYLAPTMVDVSGSVQVANAQGRQVILPGMAVHIGRTEDAPTECIIGLPVGDSPVAGWTPLDLTSFPVEFARLFGRAPLEIEHLTWVP